MEGATPRGPHPPTSSGGIRFRPGTAAGGARAAPRPLHPRRLAAERDGHGLVTARRPAVGGAPRGCPAGPPSLRRRTRPPAPSRAGSPADVSRPCAQRPRGGGRSCARGGGRRAAGGGGSRRAAGRCPRPPLPRTRPLCTWMYRSAVRSTLRFEVFLSSTLGILRFRVSKHSFRWALLRRGGRAPVGQCGGKGGGEGRPGESWGTRAEPDRTLARTHAPVLLQLVVHFSGSDPATQTDKRLREEGPARRPSCPDPHSQMPRAFSGLSPKAARADVHPVEGTCMLIIHSPLNPPFHLRQKGSWDSKNMEPSPRRPVKTCKYHQPNLGRNQRTPAAR